jgi:hypothetical protein
MRPADGSLCPARPKPSRSQICREYFA